VIAAISLTVGASSLCFASDWDKAGKALAVIEGMRVITGGNVDIIGTVTGINKDRDRGRVAGRDQGRDHDRGFRSSRFERREQYECERVWVAHYIWKEKYIPEHVEYRPGIGQVTVAGHFEKYLVEDGGHWEKVIHCARR
jgi:hypothetical protein